MCVLDKDVADMAIVHYLLHVYGPTLANSVNLAWY